MEFIISGGLTILGLFVFLFLVGSIRSINSKVKPRAWLPPPYIKPNSKAISLKEFLKRDYNV